MSKDIDKFDPFAFDEPEPVSEVWQVLGSLLIGFVLFGIAVFAALMFLTGVWLWSLLM